MKGATRSLVLMHSAHPAKGLDEDAAWLVAALRRLLRRGKPALHTAWEWVEWFDELRSRAMRIRNAADTPPAKVCPLIPVRMPAELPGWPERNEAIPVEYAEREVGAVDNRRLVGRVVDVLLNNIALHRSAALNATRGDRVGNSKPVRARADRYALETQAIARRALREVDLDALAQAALAESAAGAEQRTRTEHVTADGPPEVHFASDRHAVVTVGRIRSEVRGERRVWLLRQVVEAGKQGITWRAVLRLDMQNAANKLAGRRVPAATPRVAMRAASFHRLGSHIRASLRRLAYLWHQNGEGVRWADDTE